MLLLFHNSLHDFIQFKLNWLAFSRQQRNFWGWQLNVIVVLCTFLALQRWNMSIPTGASGWKQPLCVTPTPRGWHPGGISLLCHQLGHKPTSQQVLILGCEAHHTNRGQWRNRTFASGNMRFASCSALWSIFGVMAMQLKFNSLEKNQWN